MTDPVYEICSDGPLAHAGGKKGIQVALETAFPGIRLKRVSEDAIAVLVIYTHNAPGAPNKAAVRQFLLDRFGAHRFKIPTVTSAEFPPLELEGRRGWYADQILAEQQYHAAV